ncbi:MULTISPECIES: YXWGXW repeat-containing protein [unclassified Variovorax]|uniref:YXWGXW repeat-containing protein n=1 Tax=unclassified Variovorax TaxID=663243 RepID=UPI000C5FF6EC|nr:MULTISPECIES: YXWGXW repeat-containing protein [unclassified Variovorax]MBS79688.1 hypothetical protein [Variovorax sp.]MCT8177082.1 YXWGXW repeat-containing protein [Variovorax sp. CY25R-8]
MKLHLNALALAGALSFFGICPPATAQVAVNINVPGLVIMAPPAPRYEAPPAPRGGFVWVPGRWAWNGQDYAWRPGRWVKARAGYDYAPGRWVEDRGGWRWSEGNWRRREGWRERHEHHERHERRRDRDAHRHHEHGPYHCPPGQAKKGRC